MAMTIMYRNEAVVEMGMRWHKRRGRMCDVADSEMTGVCSQHLARCISNLRLEIARRKKDKWDGLSETDVQ